MAQDDVAKARAALAQTHDAYLPSVNGTTDLGYSYGAPIGEPRLFTFAASSLVFNYSQHDYIRAAVSGLAAANSSLEDAREAVEEDAAVTYLALDRDRQRREALAAEFADANRLAAIVQQRLDAGQDTPLELLHARRTAAQVRLQLIQLDGELDTDRAHLARLIGMPNGPLDTEPASVPALPAIARTDPTLDSPPAAGALPDTPAVAAAFSTARAKFQQANGDDRYLYRPQIAFFAEYSRFSTFNNYQVYYPAFANNTLNAIGIGIQITIPFYDRLHVDKARESYADAQHAEHEAVLARDQMFEGRTKLQHASAELAAQADLADLDHQIAQKQLDAVLIQLQAGNGNPASPQPTPKDEQNARIEEHQRTLDLLDATGKLQTAQIQILRQTGQLESWLKAALAAQHAALAPAH
jgi:outer membrane protein TolC